MRPLVHSVAGLLLVLLVGCGNRPSPDTGPQVFVGEIAGSDALIALVVEQGRFLAYSCGGPDSWQQLTGWFEGELQGGSLPATTGSYGLVLKASSSGTGWSGTLEAEGQTRSFSLALARPDSPAGLYILDNEAREAGLIIANNLKTAGVYYGKQSGVTATVQVKDDLAKIATRPTQLTVTSPAYGGSEFTLSSTTKVQATPVEPRLPIPVNLHRLAAQMLEETRGSEMAPDWSSTARLAGTVRPFYRPDIAAPAYFELPVLPQGFILVSNGEHDYPIAHWSDTFTLSKSLEASVKDKGQTSARYYKLDTLFYVAEDSQGNRIASYGNEIAQIVGVSFNQTERTVVATATPQTPQPEDTDPTNSRFVIRQDPPPSIAFRPWGSWREQKSGFASAYAPWLRRLTERAKSDWEVEKAIQRNGEALVAGNKYEVATLYPDVKFRTDRDVSAHITLELKKSSDARVPDTLVISVRASAPENTAFGLELSYRNGVTEMLRYTVVRPPAVPSGVHVQADDWSRWTYHSAGGNSDQRTYWQETHPTKGCPTGCGPVAWAMLFGWADFKAAQDHPRWKNRRGIYRENGGRTGGAVAPKVMDQGIRNVILELNQAMDTYCFVGGGLTEPWDMIGASGYLEGRTAASLRTEYSGVLIPTDGLRTRAQDSIRRNDTPAVVGIGLAPAHYPLAYKYRYRTRLMVGIGPVDITEYQYQFKVNQGFGRISPTSNEPITEWIPADTWFVGEILP